MYSVLMHIIESWTPASTQLVSKFLIYLLNKKCFTTPVKEVRSERSGLRLGCAASGLYDGENNSYIWQCDIFSSWKRQSRNKFSSIERILIFYEEQKHKILLLCENINMVRAVHSCCAHTSPQNRVPTTYFLFERKRLPIILKFNSQFLLGFNGQLQISFNPILLTLFFECSQYMFVQGLWKIGSTVSYPTRNIFFSHRITENRAHILSFHSKKAFTQNDYIFFYCKKKVSLFLGFFRKRSPRGKCFLHPTFFAPKRAMEHKSSSIYTLYKKWFQKPLNVMYPK